MIAALERWMLSRRIDAAQRRLDAMVQANRAKASGYAEHRRAGKLGWARRRAV